MKVMRALVAGGFVLCLAPSMSAQAQVSEQTMQSISTPDMVESRLGALEFKDGAPSAATVEKLYISHSARSRCAARNDQNMRLRLSAVIVVA
jgi:hypothetical protein